jgi:hypothetical protein
MRFGPPERRATSASAYHGVFARTSIVLMTTVMGAFSHDRNALGCAGHRTSIVVVGGQ